MSPHTEDIFCAVVAFCLLVLLAVIIYNTPVDAERDPSGGNL